jgi:hypothetical protein
VSDLAAAAAAGARALVVVWDWADSKNKEAPVGPLVVLVQVPERARDQLRVQFLVPVRLQQQHLRLLPGCHLLSLLRAKSRNRSQLQARELSGHLRKILKPRDKVRPSDLEDRKRHVLNASASCDRDRLLMSFSAPIIKLLRRRITSHIVCLVPIGRHACADMIQIFTTSPHK